MPDQPCPECSSNMTDAEAATGKCYDCQRTLPANPTTAANLAAELEDATARRVAFLFHGDRGQPLNLKEQFTQILTTAGVGSGEYDEPDLDILHLDFTQRKAEQILRSLQPGGDPSVSKPHDWYMEHLAKDLCRMHRAYNKLKGIEDVY